MPLVGNTGYSEQHIDAASIAVHQLADDHWGEVGVSYLAPHPVIEVRLVNPLSDPPASTDVLPPTITHHGITYQIQPWTNEVTQDR